MPSNEQLLYLNAFLFCGIALLGIRLVIRARKTMAGKDGRYVALTVVGRLCPALGCVVAGFVYLQVDLIRAVAVLVAFAIVGISLSLIGNRFVRSDRGRP